MRFKFPALVAFLFLASVCAYGQTRRPAPQPSPSPQIITKPSSTPDTATPSPQTIAKPTPEPDDWKSQPTYPPEMPDLVREHLKRDLDRAEKVLQTSATLANLGGTKPGDATVELGVLLDVFEQGPRDILLARAILSDIFDKYYDKPAQSTSRLLLLQAAQNQMLIEQNKKVIQLLTELAKRK